MIKMMIALGIVIAIMGLMWAIQEWHDSRPRLPEPKRKRRPF